MATEKDILQKVNDYCTEKQYTLDDSFRQKFAEKFNATNADANLEDSKTVDSIKFNIDTAFAAISKSMEKQAEVWKGKENEFLKQIDELKKNGAKNEPPKKQPNPEEKKKEVELPEDVKKQIEDLRKFQAEQQKQEKLAKVLDIAQKTVRADLHPDLKALLSMMQIDYSKSDEDLAKTLSDNFSVLYKNKIGDTRPIAAEDNRKKYADLLKGLPKVKI